MILTRCLVAATLLGVCACTAPETGVVRPQLAFRISAETGLTGARDLTVDGAGNLYVFDYGEYVIRKFDSAGTLLSTFGGMGESPGRFQHLMAIRALGDSLVALDAGSLSVFDLAGGLLSRRPFADTIICDFPRVHPDGRWVGERIVGETAEQVLTYRRADGGEHALLASFALGEHFPGVEPGELFYINRTQGPIYLYDFLADGRLVWMLSDRLRVIATQDGQNETVYEAEATPIPFPRDEIAALSERQARLSPPLFMNVPEHYQVVQHLVVDETGDIWLYLTSGERTGLLRLSPGGKEKGFYTVEADFDLLSARLTAAGGQLYFMVSGREETAIHSVALP